VDIDGIWYTAIGTRLRFFFSLSLSLSLSLVPHCAILDARSAKDPDRSPKASQLASPEHSSSRRAGRTRGGRCTAVTRPTTVSAIAAAAAAVRSISLLGLLFLLSRRTRAASGVQLGRRCLRPYPPSLSRSPRPLAPLPPLDAPIGRATDYFGASRIVYRTRRPLFSARSLINASANCRATRARSRDAEAPRASINVGRARMLFIDDNSEIRHTYRTYAINVKRRPIRGPSNRGHLTPRTRIITRRRFYAMPRVRRERESSGCEENARLVSSETFPFVRSQRDVVAFRSPCVFQCLHRVPSSETSSMGSPFLFSIYIDANDRRSQNFEFLEETET